MKIPKKRGPKTPHAQKKIDWRQFNKLCAIQCTQEEIAAFFDISVDTLARAVEGKYKMKFADFFAQKKTIGKRSLRRKMFAIAQSGNPTLLIWLSKQHLGFSEKVQSESKVEVTEIPKSEAEIKKLLEESLERLKKLG